MVLRPSLPPNHSKTTRILPVGFAATLRLAWANTLGTGPTPPKSPNPTPPAPSRSRSRRDTPLAPNGFFVVMRIRLPRTAALSVCIVPAGRGRGGEPFGAAPHRAPAARSEYYLRLQH